MSLNDGGDIAASIDAGELDQVMDLLRRLFDVRITFYDATHEERESLSIKGRTDYCAARRRDPAFKARCDACDRRHLGEGRRQRRLQVYRCHDGLYEAVVPIHDRDGHYLGSFMLGQLRPDDERTWTGPAQRLRQAMPRADGGRVADLAALLHRLADHLLVHQVLVRTTRPWAEAAEAYIVANLGRRITVAGLAKAVGRSPSFVTHRFAGAFGAPLHRHLVERRLLAARERILHGDRLGEVASDLGFCDAFHLSRCFSARWGMPPAALRPRT